MRALLLAGVVIVSYKGSAEATMIGDVVHALDRFPNATTTAYDGGTQTIANGTTFNLGGLLVTATFSDTQVTLTKTTDSNGYLTTSFNGAEFMFLSGPTITSVTENAASTAAFAMGSVLTFSGNDIALNLAGTCSSCAVGSVIILDVVTSTAVPEPASLALLGMGVASVAALRRRRAA